MENRLQPQCTEQELELSQAQKTIVGAACTAYQWDTNCLASVIRFLKSCRASEYKLAMASRGRSGEHIPL